jgi:two-component system NtrC family sensor kinase
MRGDDLATAKILIVDDEPANVRLLERLLGAAGYHDLESTTDPREVLRLHRAFGPDLILLDLMMPHLDGVAVLEQLKVEIPSGVFLPVLVLTADVTLEAKRRALTAGAHDFLTKPFEQMEVVLRIGNLLATRRLYLALEAQNRSLDATVQERTERLLQSEKVATMGSLLAGVAHELNNPLAVVSAQGQMLRERVSDPDIIRRADKIVDATGRCVRIVRNFLALARQHPPERTDVVIGQVIHGAVELLAYELRADGVEIAIDVAEGLPPLLADPHQLHQVLVNLVANAYQAMRRKPPPRGITVSARHDAARRLVRVEVADTGPGMTPEVQARIFEPFFTTKPPGEGTGLGLALCRGMIEDHGGTIAMESEPGHGTRFTIELPLVERGKTEVEAASADRLPAIAQKTILVLDDEPDIAAVVAEALESDGHQVDVATNAVMALEMLGQRSYDLVVSDTKMPVMDGEAFFVELERRDPTFRRRFIFLTGDVLSREKREFLEGAGAPFLTKPFDLREVRRLVQRVLAANAVLR